MDRRTSPTRTPRPGGAFLVLAPVLALSSALALAGCSSPSTSAEPAEPPAATSATTPAPPAAEGPRLVAGGLSVVQPEGWDGGRTDAASLDATLASMDPWFAERVAPQLTAAADQGVVGTLVDVAGVTSGDDADVAVFAVLEPLAGSPDLRAEQLEQVVAGVGGTSVTTGQVELPLGTARTVEYDKVINGTGTHTTYYLVPGDEQTLAVSTSHSQGRDTADLEAMVASLRLA